MTKPTTAIQPETRPALEDQPHVQTEEQRLLEKLKARARTLQDDTAKTGFLVF